MSVRHLVAVFALLVSAGLYAQAPADKPAEAAAPAPTPADAHAQAPAAAVKPGDATAGQAKAGVCAACHGIDGNPASSQYP
jgi:cytochrome c553